MSPDPPLVRRCTFCCTRGKEPRALFFRRRFLVSCSTSVCICCTSPQPIYWSKCPRRKTGESKRARAKISRKMENFLSFASAAAWAVSGWCFSSSSTCQNWDSTSPDSFTSPMRTIRKCKRTLHSFLGFRGGLLTVGCISGLTCGRSASCLHGWLRWPSCSWQWALVWLVQRTRDWTWRRATLTRC